MNSSMKSAITLSFTLFGASLFIVGCSDKTPEVSAENCKIQNINKIEDEVIRADFADKCFHSGEVIRSPSKSY